MNDKILILLVWIFMGIFFSCAGLSVVFPSVYWIDVMLMVGLCWGGVGLYWMWSYKYTRWSLNKDRRKNPLSWKTRLKLAKKPVIKNQDGKKISLTGRGEIVFLTILAWLVFEIIGIVWKINYVASFEIACIAGFLVLGSLIVLYFSRKKKRIIEKFRPKPRITKVGFVVAPSLLWLMAIWGSSQFTANGWIIGMFFGGILSGLFWIRLALRVRKTNWKKFSWDDALKTVSKSTRNYNAMSRWARNVIKSKKVSF